MGKAQRAHVEHTTADDQITARHRHIHGGHGLTGLCLPYAAANRQARPAISHRCDGRLQERSCAARSPGTAGFLQRDDRLLRHDNRPAQPGSYNRSPPPPRGRHPPLPRAGEGQGRGCFLVGAQLRCAIARQAGLLHHVARMERSEIRDFLARTDHGLSRCPANRQAKPAISHRCDGRSGSRIPLRSIQATTSPTPCSLDGA